ncbi:ashwin [Microcaecilia unicolor]|uniref:Ashwin n=1 Tax=Microcaecilia unicolor TaxID=1415580 RepID=A0A6P7XWH8_9AMPH|nr:ashwin [Microcaecilia unicolor]
MAMGDGRPLGSDLLLQPELLSQEFLLLTLEQKNISVEEAINDKQKLTDIYIQHAMPLPQRDLPQNRWGKMMEKKRGKSAPAQRHISSVAEGSRKRPLIVFDGSSTSTSIKVKKTDNGATINCLKPPPSGSVGTTIRKLSSPPCSSSSTPPASCLHKLNSKLEKIHNTAQQNSTPVNHQNAKPASKSPPSLSLSGTSTIVKLKRAALKEEADSMSDTKPTDAKKKIQHVTWP